MSLREIIEQANNALVSPKQKKYGLNQIRDNLQDPVKLAVKEVLKSEREKLHNIPQPGPGHYQGIYMASPKSNKNFSVKPGSFLSIAPRFKEPQEKAKRQPLKQGSIVDGSLTGDIDPSLPIYDL